MFILPQPFSSTYNSIHHKMRKLAVFVRDIKRLIVNYLRGKAAHFLKRCHDLAALLCNLLLFHVSSLWIQLGYYITVSVVGYLALKATTTMQKNRIREFDVFFTSVSATTASSMSTVEMEDFSNAQLIVITILMLLSGEVFISLLELELLKAKLANGVGIFQLHNNHNNMERIELGFAEDEDRIQQLTTSCSSRISCLKLLSYVVLGYLLVVHLAGSTLVSLYLQRSPEARGILETKGINIKTFSIFLTVSTFANCGFVPTNENMLVFRKNTTLVLLLIPQILLGNTLYPPCLRVLLWALDKFTYKSRKISDDETGAAGGGESYFHLVSGIRARYMAMTATGFIVIQLALFCSMQWNSAIMEGLTPYQRFVNSLFQVVNSRHSGESVFDLSALLPAILVLFTLMMYLPPYTTFLPPKYQEDKSSSLSKNGEKVIHNNHNNGQRRRTVVMITECLRFSQLSYLVIFVICICITESDKMVDDPLNFNIASITIEVISAYGNVGFSTGFSCARRINPNGYCRDACYGLSGRFSTKGKLIIVIIMFFGKWTKFNQKAGKAWLL